MKTSDWSLTPSVRAISRLFYCGIIFHFLSLFLLADEPILAKDQEWGDLTGRFLFDGPPPKPMEVRIDKDEKFVKEPIYSESLVVDAKTRGIANVLLRLMPNEDAVLRIHSDYEKDQKEPVTMSVTGFRFHPHIALVRTGQPFVIRCKDPVGHNPKVDYFNNSNFSEIAPFNGTYQRVLSKPESYPSPISCSVHPWETGWVMVQDHPYMALTVPTGEFTLKNLPVGKHKFCVWHETCGFVTKATLDGRKQEWKKGRIELDIKPGRNDLGDIIVPGEILKRKDK